MFKEFESKDELKKYLREKLTDIVLGEGSEGKCYLGKDGLAYKVIDQCFIKRDVSSIITSNDYQLKHFAFPIDVYYNPEKNIIYGYNSKTLKGDIFSDNYFILDDINTDAMISAYYELLEDVKTISEDNIYLFEAINNLLFNNSDYMLIDTLDYKKMKDPYKQNEKIILDAIKMPFYVQTSDSKIEKARSIEKVAEYVKKHVKKREYY